MKKQWIVSVLIVVIVIIAEGGLILSLINDNRKQKTQIKSLEEAVSRLSDKRGTDSPDKITWLEDGYNYLAIGNSITIHNITSYWWNEVGMAASDGSHDYFHLVSDYLKKNNTPFMGIPFGFSVWETQSNDRNETLSLLDNYLSSEIDLVTIQLGENATDLVTFQEDYVSLIKHVKLKAPNARILVIGDFWISENRNELKKNAAEQANVEFISLDGIADNPDFYCGVGATVYDEYGNEHIVEHSGVAKHPGDNGMQQIADRIIEVLDS